MTAVDRMVVVLPARNEERRLGAALDALAAARRTLAATEPGLRIDTVVVLDRCTDGSADVLRRYPDVRVVVTTAGMAGAARRAGVGAALADTAVPAERTWIANTDADSLVPPGWLRHHLEIARGGADLLLGTVLPEATELDGGTLADWLERHPQIDGHPYVHGANLGVRADVYLRAGGFRAVAVHEDVLLAAAVRGAGGSVVSAAGSPVRTSARLVGRTPGGFAGYLDALRRRPGGVSAAGFGQQ